MSLNNNFKLFCFIFIFSFLRLFYNEFSTFNLSIPMNYKIFYKSFNFNFFLSETGAALETVGAPIKRVLFSMDCFLSNLVDK